MYCIATSIILMLLLDDDRIQDMLYQMSQIPEVSASVHLSGYGDITSGPAAGGMSTSLVIDQKLIIAQCRN